MVNLDITIIQFQSYINIEALPLNLGKHLFGVVGRRLARLKRFKF